MEQVKCNYCHSGNFSQYQKAADVFTQEEFSLVKCRECGLVYLNPRPSLEEIGGYYPEKEYFLESQRCVYAYNHREASSAKPALGSLRLSAQRLSVRRFFQGKPQKSPLKEKIRDFVIAQRFGRFKSAFSKGRVLDVGCGDASFLACLKDAGWEVYGTEVSAVAAKKASENKIRVFAGDLPDARYEESFFDLVRMWSVLEHLHNPAGYLKEIYRISKKGGAVVIQVPNIRSLAFRLFRRNWCALDVPRHLYHFDKKHLAALIKQQGFIIKDIHTISVGTVASSCKADKNSFLKAFLFVFEIILNYAGLGDSLVCHAEK